MKYMKKTLLLCLIAALILPLVACGNQNQKPISGEQSLEIYVWDAGYGVSWMKKDIENFKQLDWVKEKYPNLEIKLVTNNQQNYAETRITAGSANSIDLLFGPSLKGTFKEYCVDLTELVYNTEVPGEDILYKDKVKDYALSNAEYRDDTGRGTGKYYTAVVGAGTTSYIYNQTLFDVLGLTVPNTTDELIALCQKVKNLNGSNSMYPYTTTIISSQVAYSDRIQDIWWAQYDGVDGYNNYWNAIGPDGTRNSTDIFEYEGRLKTAQVFESIYSADLGYFDRTSANYAFIQGQTRLLTGEGLMIACGEWFSNEMRDLAVEYQNRGYDYEIRMMKLPVISSIIEKTPTIKNDEMLSQVVADIDKGLETPSNSAVSAEDYATVRAARGIITARDSSGSHAVIPAVSDAKELAADFLRYLATDDALKTYAEETSGGFMPFEYNIEEDFPELHQSLLEKYGKTYYVLWDAANMCNTDYVSCVSGASYVMASYGGFNAWLSKYAGLETTFMSDASITAEQIISEHRDYWLGNNASNFQNALKKAGL